MFLLIAFLIPMLNLLAIGNSLTTQETKCPSSMPFMENTHSDICKNKLLVFASFSLPAESWKEHSHTLQKLEGSFILRGLPSNSFSDLSKKMKDLRKKEVLANIDIDPELFEKYNIDSIPTIVLIEDDKFDKVSGNIPIKSALKLFAEKGQTTLTATELLKMLENK